MRFVAGFVILLVFAFVFLRIHGVPGPLLREAVRRVNAAGIPVDVDRIRLTLRGWRAENVRYYSTHPDDLEPMFHAEQVLLAHMSGSGEEVSDAWHVDVASKGIAIAPSVEWGIGLPGGSRYREVEDLHLSLGFFPDHIELSEGSMRWVDAVFAVNGTILKKPASTGGPKSAKPRKESGKAPELFNAAQFQAFEERMKVIQVLGGTEVEVDFLVDAGNYAASQVSFGVKATDIVARKVGFSGAELNGQYRYPTVEIERLALAKDNLAFEVNGKYDLASGMVEGAANNTIESKELLLLLPQPVLDLLDVAQVHFEYLPQFSIHFGAAKPKELLNAVSGSFSIDSVTYRDLEIDHLEGKVDRRNDRLDLGGLSGTVLGQEDNAQQYGSCMVGGSATGAVFWDSAAQEFGVSASGSFDPNLVIRPLEMVKIATNVLDRFKFKDRPPQISLELGSSLVDWSTFYINVQGMANNMLIHGVELSSVNTSARYKHGILRLDPLAAMQGVDFIKGSTSIDFKRKLAEFDAFGSLQPAVLEDVVYAGFNLFGNKILTEGDTQIRARGQLDWATMRETEFSAEVEADSLQIPVARLDGFAATVKGEGKRISVADADFGLYGGKGEGWFSIQLDPETNAMPYGMMVDVEDVDFRQFLSFLRPGTEYKVTGKMKGRADFEADMALDFFESANGTGSVDVKDGQLADLPFFSGFSKAMRMLIPSFSVFSITSLSGTFALVDGAIFSDDAYFKGDLVNASMKGNYTKQQGFDALIQTQVFSDKGLAKLARVITNPIFKFFELKLEGTLAEPAWRLNNLSTAKKDSGQTEENTETN